MGDRAELGDWALKHQADRRTASNSCNILGVRRERLVICSGPLVKTESWKKMDGQREVTKENPQHHIHLTDLMSQEVIHVL
jgi:hypothetical protein